MLYMYLMPGGAEGSEVEGDGRPETQATQRYPLDHDDMEDAVWYGERNLEERCWRLVAPYHKLKYR